MLDLFQSNGFKKDMKRLKKRGADIDAIKDVIDTLRKEEPLAKRHKDHLLIGNFKEYRECHIKPDWLLIYKIQDNVLRLIRTGSHSDLF